MAPSPTPFSMLPAEAGTGALEEALGRLSCEGGVLGLAPERDAPALGQALGQGGGSWLDHGPAVVVGSGGSQGGRRWCLQPLARLEASAAATGAWLGELGIEPGNSLVVNPLPWHHVSGLMPWLRARHWGAAHHWLPAAQLRDPETLAPPPSVPGKGAALLSLVPTQLHRLLAHPAGVRWLRGFAVIWIGGAPLARGDRARGRAEGLRLAPCYGSTETGSMVTAQSPEAFLAGRGGCGCPLPHARVRIGASGAVEIQASSLCPGHLEGGRLQPLELVEGWWRSGDRGRLEGSGLTLLGRLDGAVHSGGETVFPEQVELRLRTLADQRALPLAALVLVAQPDPEWGERLVALVRGEGEGTEEGLIRDLRDLAQTLPPAQRPRDWRPCGALGPNAMGKWERGRWRDWLLRQP
ncbi:MAG: AMP-binding protein [Cyanobacteriota bacterium]|nr:AMP-binding protein [Cyanobacteriota bacterium]